MKIFCLSTLTSVSDFCGLGCNRIVSNKSAIDDYVNEVKHRVIEVVSKKPYLKDYDVFISVFLKSPNSNGVFVVKDHYTLVLKLISDNYFHTHLIR